LQAKQKAQEQIDVKAAETVESEAEHVRTLKEVNAELDHELKRVELLKEENKLGEISEKERLEWLLDRYRMDAAAVVQSEEEKRQAMERAWELRIKIARLAEDEAETVKKLTREFGGMTAAEAELASQFRKDLSAYEDRLNMDTLTVEQIQAHKQEMFELAEGYRAAIRQMEDAPETAAFWSTIAEALGGYLLMLDDLEAQLQNIKKKTYQNIEPWMIMTDAMMDFRRAEDYVASQAHDTERSIKDLNAALDEQAKGAIDDLGRAIIDVPFSELQNALSVTADAGDSFAVRMAAAFHNVIISVLLTIAKVKILKALLGVGESEFVNVAMGGLARGGLIGRDAMVPKYARGGPMRGKSGGDVNLGLFHSGEYLVPSANVTATTLPLLESIRRGNVPAYAQGGPVGGVPTPIGQDIQIVNVVTEDMVMGVVDRHKKVILNYVNSDIMSGGPTRRNIRGSM
jgi:hypothetical protein